MEAQQRLPQLSPWATQSMPIRLSGEITLTKHEAPMPYATKVELESYKSIIIELYRKHPLSSVVSTMTETYGVKATPKMYKDRFAAWAVSKYDKPKPGQRRQQRLSEKIGKRCGVSKDASRPKTLSLNEKTAPDHLKPKLMTYHGYIRVPKRLDNAAIDRPENIMRGFAMYMESYAPAYSHAKIHTRHSLSAQGFQLECLFDKCETAIQSFNRGHYVDGRKMLVVALAALSVIVGQSHILLRESLFKILFDLAWNNLVDLAISLCRHFSDMISRIFSHSYPLAVAFFQIRKIIQSREPHIFETVLRSICDTLDRIAGQDSSVAVSARSSYIWIVLERDKPHAVKLAWNMLNMVESSNRVSRVKTLQMRLVLADILLASDLLDDAEHVIRESFTFIDLSRPETHTTWPHAEFHETLAQVYKERGDRDAAEFHIRASISLAEATWGEDGSIVLDALSELEEWLIDWDEPDKAAEVRAERLSRLAVQYTLHSLTEL